MTNSVFLSYSGHGRRDDAVGEALKVYKYDAFIVAAGDGETRRASFAGKLLRAADFVARLCVGRSVADDRWRAALRAFEKSASCILFFDAAGESPLSDAWLVSAIRERHDAPKSWPMEPTFHSA